MRKKPTWSILEAKLLDSSTAEVHQLESRERQDKDFPFSHLAALSPVIFTYTQIPSHSLAHSTTFQLHLGPQMRTSGC